MHYLRMMGVEVFKEKKESAKKLSAELETNLDQIEGEDMDCIKEKDLPDDKNADENDIVDNEEGSAEEKKEAPECLEESITEQNGNALAGMKQDGSIVKCSDGDDNKNLHSNVADC